jgi:hypothetical protein
LADPHWDQNGEEEEWHQCHFIHLVVEGLKKAKGKPLNYSQITVVQQGPDENPLTFLQCFKDAIQKHITVDPDSQVGEVLLKDKFLTQSAPHICRKLQKSVAKGEIAALRECPTQACYHCEQEEHLLRQCPKQGQSRKQPRRQPCPQLGPFPL